MWGIGNRVAPTPPSGDSSNRVADTAFVTSALAAYVPPAFGAVTVQTFTSGSGTYTPTAGTKRIRVLMVGGGGGGGGATANNGTGGGTTTFGSWTAIGGGGGTAAFAANTSNNPIAGGTGGANGTGTLRIRIPGGNGGFGVPGGTGIFGYGPMPQVVLATGTTNVGSTGNSAAANTGAGGVGGYSFNTTTGVTAALNGGGGETVEFWVQGPSATSYAVGSAGSGGAAGTFAGGNGAAGTIIIEEYPF